MSYSNILIVLLSANLAIYAGAEPTGYKFVPGTSSLYKLHSVPETFDSAKQTCKSEGTTLFYPDTEFEANAVLTTLGNLEEELPSRLVIALTRSGRQFQTLNGTIITKSKASISWLKGEPNNQNGNENCVEIIKYDGKWVINDYACDRKKAFICQFPVKSWNLPCDMPNTYYKYAEAVGRCYRIDINPKTWTEAREVCRSEGADLAVINSHQEANYLVEQISKTLTLRIPGTFVRGVVHLGFHNNHVEDWQTNDGTSLYYSGYACWGSQQPGEDKCGSMLYNGHLNAIGCQQKAIFICEHSAADYPLEPPSGDLLRQSLTCFNS